MQTGYPTFATFHASSVGKLIQRMTSAPISVPPQFMPNLNVVLVQLAVHVGGKRLRRVIEVEEIEGYSRRLKSPLTRQVFRWDPVKDQHEFTGRNNSYVLENLVAYLGNMLERATGFYLIGNGEKLTVALIIVITVLTLKPSGLFGRVTVKRV